MRPKEIIGENHAAAAIDRALAPIRLTRDLMPLGIVVVYEKDAATAGKFITLGPKIVTSIVSENRKVDVAGNRLVAVRVFGRIDYAV